MLEEIKSLKDSLEIKEKQQKYKKKKCAEDSNLKSPPSKSFMIQEADINPHNVQRFASTNYNALLESPSLKNNLFASSDCISEKDNMQTMNNLKDILNRMDSKVRPSPSNKNNPLGS